MKIQFDQTQKFHINKIYGPIHQEVNALSFHSKRVEPQSVFFCLQGDNFDGHKYVEEAIAQGACVIIGSDGSLFNRLVQTYDQTTFLLVNHVRSAMAAFSKEYFNRADEELKTVGVTGTNGKTTVAAYIRSLLTLLGLRTGSIGTTGIWSSTRKLNYKKSTPTTPESMDIHRIFRDFRNLNDQGAVMEVSSIALDQCRVEGIQFDVAVHTNFSEDHMEYHRTMDHYRECKMRLFHQANHRVVNLDDDGMASELLAMGKDGLLTYSINNHPEADLSAIHLKVMEKGTQFSLKYRDKTVNVELPVYGNYNVANLLAAIATALHLGFSFHEILKVLPNLESPEGRFQVIETPLQQKVILDYAHTPVALERLVEEVKKMNYRRLIVMVAGVGIRDFNKMPKMANAIEGKADEVIVTVDHPAHHDPQIIVDKVMTGFINPGAGNIHSTLTREEGIRKSMSLGQEGDIILLTGGCINNAQIVKGEEVPHFDEKIIESFFPRVVQ
ncbi:UDP-N-acetylmuramoylalanyl-D-glutamate--2,6-diaminopimelate ligase [Halobacillus karajensis]|uniref:UDP-N-acetylmuramoyl-L-alanyl-D-glutamate--2, 6-diaminopimelate ligase n=1 Tax=Halobacillus karajensis TaxID=195088 RepID=UPI0008A747D1|nr:UDP-N-acetylmuramoyl-L-alanyl-D-glutamate--2,6-diaminopimelate ligase [Halobacillus karajensis]SEI07558.1 UDP-N-acetylmuramoylalanyl-D-glutamate--2,6-diaminopimelate ligase [Halobacillus karajensis]